MFIKSNIEDVDVSNLPPPEVQPCGRKVVSECQRYRMKELYESGLSTWKIANLFGYKNVCIINNLKKIGVKLRNRSDANKTIRVNRDYFAIIDTHTKAYLLGLFYADGNVSKDSFTLALQEPDKYLLENIGKEIGFEGSLGFRRPRGKTVQNIWVLRIHDKVFCEHLIRHGVLRRKTSIVSFPYFLDRALYWSFIHGLLDGDGCVSISNNCLNCNIAGSPFIIPQIAKLIEQELGIHVSVKKARKSKSWSLSCSAMVAVRLLAIIFKDNKKFFMIRKYNKFIKHLNGFKNGHRFEKFNTVLYPILSEYLK